MINYKILIDGVDYTKNCSLPFKEQYVLDSALDNGVLTLPMTSKNTVFKPFTLVEITKDNDTFNMYIASDNMTEVVGSGKFTHNLVLIEETKLLEKKIVDTNTTTQPLLHDYKLDQPSYVDEYVGTNSGDLEWTNYYQNELWTPTRLETQLILPSVVDWTDNSSLQQMLAGETYNYQVIVEDLINNTTIYNFSATGTRTSDTATQTHDISSLIPEITSNSYKLTYNLFKSFSYVRDTTIFSIVKETPTITKKSITDVVNRLLQITETLRASETPALQFNAEQATFYSNIEAPEFSMTKSTLRECLDQIGSYIHSIVRLKGNTIYFDKLGGTTQTELDANYIGSYETLDGEQYASQLDSIVSNLVNIDNDLQGTMIEPFRYGYKTVRAESGTFKIDDTSAIIETDYPIEKIYKLVCGYIYVNNKQIYVGDITPYVFENAEYKLLSSNEGIFPNSKGYAITYTQGQRNITGLTFKLPNTVSPVFSNQAILNIISQKIGIEIQSLLKVQKIPDLNFQVIYYPSTTARVKQSKTNITDYASELTSIFNQSANKVDSRAYGENLKGTIARLGNIEKFITFTTKSPDNLQNVGDYVIIDNEDYYIATIDIENQIDHTKYTIGLSKDFNALSKYIGIKNNIRLYEVSEKQSLERYITYDDYCVVGTSVASDNKHLITTSALQETSKQFTGENSGSYPISVARLQGLDNLDNLLKSVDLPVFSLGLGNSIWLGCKYEDNYSAGSQSVEPETGDNVFYRLQNYVKYTDNLGEIKSLDIKMYDYLDTINTFNNAKEVGNTLPASTLTPVKSPLLNSNNDNLVIMKDNREQINFSYQLYFVTNNGIIIGSQLAQGNRLVTNIVETPTSASLYVLPNRINKFANKIDLAGATLIRNYNQDNTRFSYTDTQIIFANENSTVNGKSWVLIDNASEKLLFGKNIAIENGDVIEMPILTFTHKII